MIFLNNLYNLNIMDKSRLDKLIEKGGEVLKSHKPNPPNVFGFPTLDSGKFTAWQTQCLSYLIANLPPHSPYIDSFKSNVERGFKSSVEKGIGILQSVKEDADLGYIDKQNSSTDTSESTSQILNNIFDKFHSSVRQLRKRYDSRNTLDVQDEYDVQDYLHAILLLHFEDIRAEESSPSYAGKNSRIDFLLKDFKIVVEIKKTRKGLTAKEIGSQLIEDIARYKVHPDCETLVCFVYDPDGYINNPRGIENDLSANSNSMKVQVIVRPK
jgi:hypothetical protein